MSDIQDPQPPAAETPPPLVIPVRYAQMPARYPMPPGRSIFGSLARTFLVLMLVTYLPQISLWKRFRNTLS